MKTPLDNGEYNLEEYAVVDEPELKPTSQFEINKESLKPTIENASEINMEPSIKMDVTPSVPEPQIIATHDDAFVIDVQCSMFYFLMSPCQRVLKKNT